MYLTQPLRGPHADCMDPNVQKGLLTLQPNHSGIASSHCIYIMPRDQKFHQPDCLCKIYSGQHYEKTSKRHDWPLSQANSPSHKGSVIIWQRFWSWCHGCVEQSARAHVHMQWSWGRGKIVAILQTAFSWTKIYEFWLQFYWRLSLRV